MSAADLQIRPARLQDAAALRELLIAAFDGPAEAALVEALQASGIELISLVAERGDQLLGQILFSPATLPNDATPGRYFCLAPMAVAPAQQRRGIGSALVEAGLQACCAAQIDALFVLGHPDYYPRFGFRRADEFGIACEFSAPAEAWMALLLRAGALGNCRAATVHFHPAFHALG
jgi:putative acetyltransferase